MGWTLVADCRRERAITGHNRRHFRGRRPRMGTRRAPRPHHDDERNHVRRPHRRGRLESKRVLIADDNRAVRRDLHLQLDTTPDITVVGEVDNGVVAVRVALDRRVDVVLMDSSLRLSTPRRAERRCCPREPRCRCSCTSPRSDRRPPSSSPSRPSPAQSGAIGALGDGLSGNEQITSHLGVSVNTVRSHVQSALKKTGLEDRTRLALWGARNRIDVGST